MLKVTVDLFSGRPNPSWIMDRSIFLHDWDKLAKQNIGRESITIEAVSRDESVPLGMTRIGWSDIQELF